jgi:hypothetical protein
MAFGDLLNPQPQAQPAAPAVAQPAETNSAAQSWFSELKKLQADPVNANSLIVFGNALTDGDDVGHAAAKVIGYRGQVDQNLIDEEDAGRKADLAERRQTGVEEGRKATGARHAAGLKQRKELSDRAHKAQQERNKVLDARDARNYSLQYGKAAAGIYTKVAKQVDESLEFAEGTPEALAALRATTIKSMMDRSMAYLPKPPGGGEAEGVAPIKTEAAETAPKTPPTFEEYAAAVNQQNPGKFSEGDVKLGYQAQYGVETVDPESEKGQAQSFARGVVESPGKIVKSVTAPLDSFIQDSYSIAKIVHATPKERQKWLKDPDIPKKEKLRVRKWLARQKKKKLSEKALQEAIAAEEEAIEFEEDPASHEN